MSIRSFYNAVPGSLKAGDVLVCTITAHVQYDGSIRVYRCEYPGAQVSSDGVPQGSHIGDETIKVEDIMPVIAWQKGM